MAPGHTQGTVHLKVREKAMFQSPEAARGQGLWGVAGLGVPFEWYVFQEHLAVPLY